jgi:electron transport complex protein RnfB
MMNMPNQELNSYLEQMAARANAPLRAIIREDECIGCTKCIQACPVDAILGAAKQMHTVIANECTGCNLCVAPCPVDCIDMINIGEFSELEQQHRVNVTRQRYEAHSERLQHEQLKKVTKQRELKRLQRKVEIAAAVARTKARKR